MTADRLPECWPQTVGSGAALLALLLAQSSPGRLLALSIGLSARGTSRTVAAYRSPGYWAQTAAKRAALLVQTVTLYLSAFGLSLTVAADRVLGPGCLPYEGAPCPPCLDASLLPLQVS